MTRLPLFAISAICLLSAEGFFHQYPKLKLRGKFDGDAGDPLFLTPYIESGNITEGRSLARVPFTDDLNITSYAGFFTVNKTHDSNQFFWYFPSKVNATNSPVVLWLQGGPGGSSLFGLFAENGPITVKNYTIEERKSNWALNHHVIYIDNPVGTGFSFTKDDAGYCTDETQVGDQLYSSIVQFFQLFPELQNNKFYVTGESYAGKYVPALAYAIHNKNPTASVKINLQGLAMGNGWSDPEHQLEYGKYLYQLGLIDWNQAKLLEEAENKAKEYIEQRDWASASSAFDRIIGMFMRMNGLRSYYNYYDPDDIDVDYEPMLQRPDIRKGIHVSDLDYNDGSKVGEKLELDIAKSVAPIISELLDYYDVLTYNGQLDMIVPYALTVNYLRNLNFTGSEDYKTAERHIWRIDEEVAGYVKKAGRLTEVMIRNAGHMVPADQPVWSCAMITHFTYGLNWGSKPSY